MDDEFEKWMTRWAAVEKEMAQERGNEPKPEPVRASYFTGMPAEYDFVDNPAEMPTDNWNDIYQRAMEIDYSNDSLITDSVNIAYMGSEGYGKQIPKTVSATGKKQVSTHNPIHFQSVGNDQENEEGRVRVTDNWNDGDGLRELDEIKKEIEAMERRLHEADVLKNSNRSKLKSQLESLRNRVKQLSEKIMSNPQDDLT